MTTGERKGLRERFEEWWKTVKIVRGTPRKQRLAMETSAWMGYQAALAADRREGEQAAPGLRERALEAARTIALSVEAIGGGAYYSIQKAAEIIESVFERAAPAPVKAAPGLRDAAQALLDELEALIKSHGVAVPSRKAINRLRAALTRCICSMSGPDEECPIHGQIPYRDAPLNESEARNAALTDKAPEESGIMSGDTPPREELESESGTVCPSCHKVESENLCFHPWHFVSLEKRRFIEMLLFEIQRLRGAAAPDTPSEGR